MPVDPRPQGRSLQRAPSPEPVVCDVCGGPTDEVRCKVICRHCGYTRDCSDP